MQQLFTFLVIIHITGGSISLLLGSYILLTKKGTAKHTLIGTIYFYAMLTAALVALPMSYIHPNYFLFIVGIFTAYMLLTGKRYLKKKSTNDVTQIDWILSLLMLAFGASFIFLGILRIIHASLFGIVFLSFGSISILFVYKDYLNFTGKTTIKNFGLVTHLQRMIGSYIASITAFLVVNNRILPPVVAWLLPTALIVPLIVKWSRKYMVK